MSYLLHFFDQHEHLRRSIRLDAETDEQAIAHAEREGHAHVMEIWTGDRCVRRFEPARTLAVA